MLFNSAPFVFLFLPVALCGFFLLGERRRFLAGLWLAACSLFFYGWWDWRFVGLLLASIAFNYGAARLIRRAGRRAGEVLAAAVTGDLALLGYYKYRGFFADTWTSLWGGHPAHASLILPLGISFFTFTQIAFLVDVRRGRAREYRFLHYLLFITYFPHLIAGPILHHRQVMPQFARRPTFRWNWTSFSVGLTIFIVGLSKKMLLADTFAGYANRVFRLTEGGGSPWLMQAWIGAVAYAFQIYFDFSGYSDMAIGLSRMFNIKLPLNFNSPYKAVNAIDFWRRWHMTLSAFLRDYLYIPLGGNRRGPLRRYANLFVTMVLGGLWHGANWTFVVWGALHGLYLAVNHAFHALRQAWGWREEAGGFAARWLARGVTFIAVVVAWVFFRAESVGAAWRFAGAMFGTNGISLPRAWPRQIPSLSGVLARHGCSFDGWIPAGAGLHGWGWLFLGGFCVVWGLPNTQEWMRRYHPAPDEVRPPAGWIARLQWNPATAWIWLFLGLAFGWEALLLQSDQASQFIYFQF